MARVTIRDDALWAKHIEDGQDIRRLIEQLGEGQPIRLMVDGAPILFRKMWEGRDGRPTAGLKPDVAYRSKWAELQKRRGEVVSLSLLPEIPVADPSLAALDGLLSEWGSPEDAAAYDGL